MFTSWIVWLSGFSSIIQRKYESVVVHFDIIEIGKVSSSVWYNFQGKRTVIRKVTSGLVSVEMCYLGSVCIKYIYKAGV